MTGIFFSDTVQIICLQWPATNGYGAGFSAGGRGEGSGEKNMSVREEYEPICAMGSHQNAWHFMSAILDMADVLLIAVNRDGRVVQFNHACVKTSGRSPEEVRGRPIWELFPTTESGMSVRTIFENMRKGQFPSQHEIRWITEHGSHRRIAWSSTALLDNAGDMEYGIWVGLDITGRKQTEAALRASEERYRALIENVKEGVALIRDAKLIFVNDAFVSVFGYGAADELIGKDARQLVDPRFEQRFTEFLTTALDKKSWGLPFRGKCIAKGRGEFWAEKLSSVISYEGNPAILVTVRDITDNMLWEQTIKQEAEYFRSENVKLKSSIGERYRLGDIIGRSPAMQEVYELILKAAANDANIIILGRSGTGKEMVAKTIHEMSDRSDRPFIPVNCGAIPENLIESEFFGYKKGAFTGAHMDREGYLRTAGTGTLFLDEVGDIPLNMQVKLLRALESGEYIPVGDSRPCQADIRIIAAMNKDPLEMVRKGRMREDFFYRISVIPIKVPELKARKEDIPLLAEHFLGLYSDGSDIPAIPPRVMDALLRYDWPGNVRELQNVLQRFLTVKSLDFMKISDDITSDVPLMVASEEAGDSGPGDLHTTLENVERKLIIRALETVRWNKTKAAQSLGISRRSLFRRMKKLGV